MKKILLSLVLVAGVSSVAILGTRAYFSDTEVSNDNTFTTGTIDIAVDGQSPWEQAKPYTLADMKPGYVDYINFEVKNVGNNPANVWKKITVTGHDNTPVSEPEAEAENGTPVTDLENVINYDLKVQVYDTPTHMAWEQVIYDEDITLAAAYAGAGDNGLYLGMLPAGWTMKVEQSYRMDEEAGNEYQGDAITFDIGLYAEQLINTVVLENKDTSSWQLLLDDGKSATLTYGVKEATFNYTLDVAGMTDGAYTLATWEDVAHNWSWGSFAGTTVLANVTVTGGTAHVVGSVDLNKDIVDSKVWLVPGNKGTPGQTGVSLNPWNPANTLFETGLIDYYDSSI